MTQPDSTEERAEDVGRQAREQAEAYNSTFATKQVTFDDGDWIDIPPHPNLRMLDDDAQAELEQFEFDLESYDRHDDIYIPEQKVKDRSGNEMTLPAQTKRGAVKWPYRKTDESGREVLLNPPYTVQVVKIAIGEEAYEKLRAAKIDGRRGSAADVWRIWNGQNFELGRRRDADSKSDAGADILEDVAEADSQRPVEVPPSSDS